MNKNYLHERHFSIAEAMQILHEYHSMLEKMKNLAQILMSSGYDFPGPGADNLAVVPSEQPREYQQLLEIIFTFHSAGIQVKNVEEGLIDFPHLRRNGQEVYLCFKYGEETIQYWHPVDTGFAGRQPLKEL